MSRVNDALAIREGSTPAAPGEQESTDAGTALNLYPEEQVPVDPGPHQSGNQPVPAPNPAPAIATAASSHRTRRRKSARYPDVDARLVTSAVNTVAIEQYRRLAAILHDVQAEKRLKTVMITSAVPEEGKSLTLVNLALTLSESYARRVLMIDADLRLPSLHEILDIPNGRGLSDALRGPRQALPFVEVSPRLSVLTAGHPGPSPLAGLSSDRMGEVLEECAARFDWVLIDTSPVGVLPDASVIARIVGGVIFVIQSGSTPAAAVERAIAEIGADSIIGTVLNQVEQRRIPTAGYYNQYGEYASSRSRR